MKTIIIVITYCMYMDTYLDKITYTHYPDGSTEQHGGAFGYYNICDLSMSFSDTAKANKAYKKMLRNKEISNIHFYNICSDTNTIAKQNDALIFIKHKVDSLIKIK